MTPLARLSAAEEALRANPTLAERYKLTDRLKRAEEVVEAAKDYGEYGSWIRVERAIRRYEEGK